MLKYTYLHSLHVFNKNVLDVQFISNAPLHGHLVNIQLCMSHSVAFVLILYNQRFLLRKHDRNFVCAMVSKTNLSTTDTASY